MERTLETLEGEGRGGGVFILSTLGRATLDRWAGPQEQPPMSHDNFISGQRSAMSRYPDTKVPPWGRVKD